MKTGLNQLRIDKCSTPVSILVWVFQVIEEIEEMMQESPDPDDDESPSQSDLSMLSQDLQGLKRSGSSSSYEERQ